MTEEQARRNAIEANHEEEEEKCKKAYKMGHFLLNFTKKKRK